jgi:hypothetical protein
VDDGPAGRTGEGAFGRHDGLLDGGPGRSFTSRLDRWVADARVDEAARARSRERWLRSVAEQEATIAGVLIDLAERGAGVALSTTAGRRHRGAIGALGADFVALRPASGPEVLVAMGSVSVLRTLPAEDPAAGDRAVSTELTLAEVLGELAAERCRVLLVTRAGSDSVSGELRSVGQDVVVLRADADLPATAYVPLGAIAEVTLG